MGISNLILKIVKKKSLCPAVSVLVTRQAPASMGFPRQEHSRGFQFPPLGDFLDSGIEPVIPVLQADS